VSDTSEGRIDREYYDSSDYHGAGAEHLVDLKSPFQRYRVDKVLQIFEPNSADRVLDLGCGWGTFCFALGHRVKEMVGVDFSRRSIEFCEGEAERRGLESVRFVEADARNTDLPEGYFDLVIAADLFEHLYPDDSEAVVQEAYRLLRRGGRLAIWTPHRGHLLEILKNNNIVLKPDPTHVDYKSMERLRTMLESAGFLVEKAYYAESHLPGFRVVEKALLPFLGLFRRRIAMLGVKE